MVIDVKDDTRYLFHVREQVRAITELGIHSWVLWNPRSVYERGYFKTDTLAATRPVGGS